MSDNEQESVTVRTQREVDNALAGDATRICIDSTDGAWIHLSSSNYRPTAHVEARDSARVVAWDGAHVVAAKYTAVHLHSQHVQLDANGAVIDMTSIDISDPHEWCVVRGVKTETIETEIGAVEIAWVYKAVNDAWTTDRGTIYNPGSTPEAPDWEPTDKCGRGLHFGVTPSHSAEYYTEATRYVRCGVSLDECVGVGDKLKARRVLIPCVEVDRYGMEVSDE